MASSFINQANISAYGIGQGSIKLSPLPIIGRRAPTTADKAELGTMWIYNNTVYVLTSVTNNAANWASGTAGSGTFSAITATTGPNDIEGTTTINTTSTAATSIGNASGAITMTALSYSIDGVAGTTYAVGASTTTGTIVIGGTAQSGAMTLGSSSATNIVNVGTGAGATTVNIASGVTNAKTVNIGTGAAMANTISVGGTGANVIAVGNTQTGGSVSVGNAMTTGTISVGGASMTGTITIGKSTSGQTINISNTAAANTVNIAGSGATTASTINIGTGAAAHQITIGSSTASNLTTIASPILALPGPVYVYTGAGAPANGLAVHVGDIYINTTAANATSRMYIATGAGAWTNVSCAA